MNDNEVGNDWRCSHSTQFFRFAWRLFCSDWIHEQDSRTCWEAHFQTGQLLFLKLSLCPSSLCNYKISMSAFFPIMLSMFIFYYSQLIHTQHTIKVDTTLYNLKCCLCPITFCIYKVSIWAFFPIMLSVICSYSINRNEFIHSPYSLKCCLCPITFCNYQCVNISLFPNSTLFYRFICYKSEWIPACWPWSISPSFIINWLSYCRIGLAQIDLCRWGNKW